MTVESFDPSKLGNQTSPERMEVLLSYVSEQDSAIEELPMSSEQVQMFAPFAVASGWVAEFAEDTTDAQVIGLIRLFTLGEMKHSSWQAGAKSPVVALVRLLKQRGTYPSELTSWIKRHSSNRFLPHGSLMDRL